MSGHGSICGGWRVSDTWRAGNGNVNGHYVISVIYIFELVWATLIFGSGSGMCERDIWIWIWKVRAGSGYMQKCYARRM